MESNDSGVMINMSDTNGNHRSSNINPKSSLFTTIYNVVHAIVLLIAFSLSIYAAKTVRDLEKDVAATAVSLSLGRPSSLSNNLSLIHI